MRTKILVIDTSILCCWLGIPGKETCGTNDGCWNQTRVKSTIDEEVERGATVVLPLATIIETGNHIAQASTKRFECASELAKLMNQVAESQSPWAAFSDQTSLWTGENLKKLASEWPTMAAQQLSFGDIAIKEVAEHYAKTGSCEVEILTGDKGLKAHQPTVPIPTPRRRKR